MGKVPEAITALNLLLEFSPTDAEAWAELADLHLSEGLYAQAIYALEEVLVLSPNAWNVSYMCPSIVRHYSNGYRSMPDLVRFL